MNDKHLLYIISTRRWVTLVAKEDKSVMLNTSGSDSVVLDTATHFCVGDCADICETIVFSAEFTTLVLFLLSGI